MANNFVLSHAAVCLHPTSMSHMITLWTFSQLLDSSFSLCSYCFKVPAHANFVECGYMFSKNFCMKQGGLQVIGLLDYFRPLLIHSPNAPHILSPHLAQAHWSPIAVVRSTKNTFNTWAPQEPQVIKTFMEETSTRHVQLYLGGF